MNVFQLMAEKSITGNSYKKYQFNKIIFIFNGYLCKEQTTHLLLKLRILLIFFPGESILKTILNII